MTETQRPVDTPAENDFRARARSWLAENAPRRDSEEVQSDDRHRYHPDRLAQGYGFHRRLWEAGLAGISCPAEYGGQGLPARYQEIWNEEVAPYALPPHGSGASLGIALPLLLVHGTEVLKREHIPRILRAEVSWCQFLSEPGAGSDLAGVRTTAALDGDEWVINGSKIWSSGAHFSKYAMCLARTDPNVPKHRGLTMFIVPIPTDGLEIRPVRQVTGGSEFNEEFLDDVRIPSDAVIGDVNDGWRVAQTMLTFERRMLGVGSISGGTTAAEPPHELAALVQRLGRTGDPVAGQLIADVWVHSVVSAETSSRVRAGTLDGHASPHIGSALKLFTSELARRRARAAMAVAGPAGIAWPLNDPHGGRWAMAYLAAPSSSIGGGTDEIQKNIVGERIIGLPREPQVDRDVPFREVPSSR